MTAQARVVVVGAGIGGLAAALRLANAGILVTVLERHSHPGGKIRTMPSASGPVDAGPTVLTLRPVFDALFRDVGEALEEHLSLVQLPVLARHFWSDGTVLDLTSDPDRNVANVGSAFGTASGRAFRAFSDRAATLFKAFDAPMMQASAPSMLALAAQVILKPSLIGAMAPHLTLAKLLRREMPNRRLAQLFGRYATYVGGSPCASPALLGLIYQAEAAGVWRVSGGMQALPVAIERLARTKGARFQYDTTVDRIDRAGAGFVISAGSAHFEADAVLFNGDPRALRIGGLGASLSAAVPAKATEPRSLSACVLAFSAKVSRSDLAHHNVFFGDIPNAEFDAIAQGNLPADATLYLCAQDRGARRPHNGAERFEIIMNAPAGLSLTVQDKKKCLTQILRRLRTFGVAFDPAPGIAAMTTPMAFDHLFPGSQGALYGRSPHGLLAAFRRPATRSRIKGLYLVGGGAHPGAGVPMATLSARHAAEAILNDLPLTSRSGQTATPGGMSTESATTEKGPSRSLDS